MKKSNNTGKIVGALVAGAVVGTALGVLFAPDKGSVTRGKLTGSTKDFTGNLKKKVKNQVEHLGDTMSGMAEDTSKQTNPKA